MPWAVGVVGWVRGRRGGGARRTMMDGGCGCGLDAVGHEGVGIADDAGADFDDGQSGVDSHHCPDQLYALLNRDQNDIRSVP